MKAKKIKTKYLIRMVVFLFLVVGGMIFIHSLFAKDYFIYNTKNEIQQFYRQIQKMDLKELSKTNQDRLDDIASSGYSITISNKNKIIYTTSSQRRRNAIEKEEAVEYVEEAVPEMIGDSQILLRGRIKQNDKVYFILINMWIRSVDSSINMNSRFLFIEMLFVILLGILFSVYLSNKTLKPVERLTRMTKQMADNEYISNEEYSFPDDEIGQLAERVQDMYDKISDSVIEEKNYNYLLKMQNRDLMDMDARKKKFIQTATHELKTPLAIISSQLEIMNIDYPEAMSEYYDSIMEEIEKMSTLIREMLKSSFMDDLEHKVTLNRQNLSEFLNDQKNKYILWMKNKRLNCVFDIQSDIYINMNQEQIDQAFNNFMMNAYEHAEPNSNVEISLKLIDGYAYLSVYNQGEKIPEKDFEEIWNNYFSKKNREDNANVGLGLYIVSAIVKTHKGECFVENTDKGVMFTMKFKAE